MDYKKVTLSFYRGWLMAFGTIMVVYTAFMAVWLKCKKFRNWLTSKLVEATLDTVDDSYESFSERFKAM